MTCNLQVVPVATVSVSPMLGEVEPLALGTAAVAVAKDSGGTVVCTTAPVPVVAKDSGDAVVCTTCSSPTSSVAGMLGAGGTGWPKAKETLLAILAWPKAEELGPVFCLFLGGPVEELGPVSCILGACPFLNMRFNLKC